MHAGSLRSPIGGLDSDCPRIPTLYTTVRLRINPRRCEAWCELDEGTREKLSNT